MEADAVTPAWLASTVSVTSIRPPAAIVMGAAACASARIVPNFVPATAHNKKKTKGAFLDEGIDATSVLAAYESKDMSYRNKVARPLQRSTKFPRQIPYYATLDRFVTQSTCACNARSGK